MSAPTRLLSIVHPPAAQGRTTPRSVHSHDPDDTLPIVARRPAIQPEVLPMKCLRCQGPVERGTAPVAIERNGCRIAWEAVPAWICTRCELHYFEPREVETIRTALRSLRPLGPRRD